MANDRTERTYERIKDNVVLEDWPIHFAGAGLFIQNPMDHDVIVTIEDSVDGTTWAPIVYSTPDSAGNVGVTLTARSYRAFLFVTANEYVRVSITPTTGYGVAMSMFQFMPRSRQIAEGVYA